MLFVSWFFFSSSFLIVKGNPSIALSSNLLNNIQITTANWKKITTWTSPSGSGHFSSSVVLRNGDFEAPISGLYSIYTTVTISGAQEGLFKVAVVINNDLQNYNPALLSSFNKSDGVRSLSVFGNIRIQIGDTVSVFVYSSHDQNWIIIGNSESTFCIEFVNLFNEISGFSSLLTRKLFIPNKQWNSLLRWQIEGTPGLYKSRTGFSEDAGLFVPICDGIYQISANVNFFVYKAGFFELAVSLNNKVNGSVTSFYATNDNSTFTISLSITLKLKKGDEISLRSKGNENYIIQTESGYFGILLNKGADIPGFSSVFNVPITGEGGKWVQIPIPVPGQTFGQFEGIKDSVSAGSFFHTSTQIFTISAVIHIEAATPTGCIISLHSDGASISSLTMGIFTTKGHKMGSNSFSISGILELPANELLFLYIYLSSTEQYKILPGSRVSVTTTQQEYQAFHVVTAAPIQMIVAGAWVQLVPWVVKKEGSYSFTSSLTNGKYIAVATGIYYISANIIFNDVHGPISVLLSVNGDKSKRKNLYATKGNPTINTDSITVSGSVRLLAGNSLAVYVHIEDDRNWLVGTDSTFSAVFIGQHFAVPGISTVLTNQISVTKNGWMKLAQWETQTLTNAMFSSGETFNKTLGNFVAPASGLYLAAASVKLLRASAKLSSFVLNIAVNGAPSSDVDQNALQDVIEHNTNSLLSNDFYSLVASGVIQVNKGKIISLYLKSSGDDSFSVSQDSSFSVIYLCPLASKYASGMQLMLSASIAQKVKDANTWRKVRYWVDQRQNTDPGVFKTGDLQELDSSSGTIRIHQSGIYMVSVNIAITGNNNFELAIYTTKVTSLITKYGQTTTTKYTMRLTGTIYLTSGQTLSVKVQSTSPSASWEQLPAYCGWSVVRIPPFSIAPTIISQLTDQNTLETGAGLWSRVRNWNTNKISTLVLSDGTFDRKNGYFTATREGIYMISCSIMYIANKQTNPIRQKFGLNGDKSFPGTKVVNSGEGGSNLISDCKNGCAVPFTQILKLNVGDIVSVYVQSNKASLVLSESTYFTVKYLWPLKPLPNGFFTQLQQTVSVTVLDRQLLKGWTVSSNTGQFYKGSINDEYLVPENGLYILSANIEFLEILGKTSLLPSVNGVETYKVIHYNEVEGTYSISIAGVIRLYSNNKYSLTVDSKTDQFYKVAKSSTSSLTYIGQANVIKGFAATFRRNSKGTYTNNIWYSIAEWSTSGTNWVFETGQGFHNKKTYIIQESGYYFVSANVIFTNSMNKVGDIELMFLYNNNMKKGLYGKKYLPAKGTITLQVHGGIYMSKWDYVGLRFKINAELVDLIMEQESTFSVVKIGQDFSSESCLDDGPKIIGKLFPDKKRLQHGSEIEWNCFATGNNPTYQWKMDFVSIPGATGTTFKKTNLIVGDTGNYVCTATTGGITTTSNIAQITVFDPLPTFLNPSNEYIIETSENGPNVKDLLFIKVKAENFESTSSDVTFKIIGGDNNNEFELSPFKSTTGTMLSRKKQLDRENISKYILQIEATNSIKPNNPAIQNITVIVTDLNDNPPVFLQKMYSATILENATIGTIIVKVSATDADDIKNSAIIYSVIPGSAETVFSIKPNSGIMTMSKLLDREVRDSYVLFVKAENGQHSAYAEVNIKVVDVNEHKPYFLKTDYTATIAETLMPSSVILRLLAADKDSGENAKIIYKIIFGDNENVFKISETGVLQTVQFLDYEKNSTYSLLISIHDNGSTPLFADKQARVAIHIENNNDNRPYFLRPFYAAEVMENNNDISPPFIISARDPDEGKSIKYEIPSKHNVSSVFEISPYGGNIRLLKPLDFEKQQYYQFTVVASDTGIPPKTSSTNVLITVLDANDNAPVFNKTYDKITTKETLDVGNTLYIVRAEDNDGGANGQVNYEIIDGNINNVFYVNPITGYIMAHKPLDREKIDSFLLKISAFDSGVPRQNSVSKFFLEVVITDVNDNPPLFNKIEYLVEVVETVSVGQTLLTMTVTDMDFGVNKEFSVTLVDNLSKQLFSIQHVKLTSKYNLVLQKALDFEDESLYQFMLLAKDKGVPSLQQKVAVILKVKDVNDNAPRFQKPFYTATLSNKAVANLTVYQMKAVDPDVGDGQIKYSIVGGNIDDAFIIEKYSGIVRTANRANLTFLATYELEIIAEDSFSKPLVSNKTTLFVRVATTPSINFEDLTAGQSQFQANIVLKELSHLENAEKLQIIVQRYYPNHPLFNLLSAEIPVSWYTVFSPTDLKDNNRLRRYIAMEVSVPLKTNKVSRRSTIKVDDKLNVIIGIDLSCSSVSSKNKLICNGPLDAGETYRLQIRVYESGSLVPIESHFSAPIILPPVAAAKLTLSQKVEDGIVALSASFLLIYITTVGFILIYVYWKQRHEIVHVDHLHERPGMLYDVKDDNYSPLHAITSYFSPSTGKIQRFGGFDGGNIWPSMSMAEHNQMLHRSNNGNALVSPQLAEDHIKFGDDNKPQVNLAFEEDDNDDGDNEGASWASDDAENGEDEDEESLYARTDVFLPMSKTDIPSGPDKSYDDQEIETTLGVEGPERNPQIPASRKNTNNRPQLYFPLHKEDKAILL